jgi:hypothetical protein
VRRAAEWSWTRSRASGGISEFTPHINPVSGEVDGYDFAGPTRFDKLFTGIAVEWPTSLVAGDRAGCEDIGPEDTFDGDYGQAPRPGV